MLALAGELRREDPRIGLLLVSDRPSELGLAAMRAGVHDILSPEASLEDFSAAVDRRRPGRRQPGPRRTRTVTGQRPSVRAVA